MTQQRAGSTRIMTSVSSGIIDLDYTKKWSVFDRGSSPQEIPKFDVARCACAVKSFELAHKAGITTHFLEQISPTRIRVLEFSVPGRESLSGKVHGRVLPLEWIWRIRAAGSLLERLKSGMLKPEELGFESGTTVTEGMKLPKLRLECTTKFEPVDRHLTAADARQLARLRPGEWEEAWSLISQAIQTTDQHYAAAGLTSPDGKLELGMTRRDRRIIMVDVFGTQDENRIIDKKSGAILSKDILRKHLAEIGWKAKLDEAKQLYPGEKAKWPPYPVLSDEFVAHVSASYAEVAYRYAGVRV